MTKAPRPGSTIDDAKNFGRRVAKLTAAQMLRPDATDTDRTTIGSEGISTILEWANSLSATGIDGAGIDELTDAAAEAFRLELELAASLLVAHELSDTAH